MANNDIRMTYDLKSAKARDRLSVRPVWPHSRMTRSAAMDLINRCEKARFTEYTRNAGIPDSDFLVLHDPVIDNDGVVIGIDDKLVVPIYDITSIPERGIEPQKSLVNVGIIDSLGVVSYGAAKKGCVGTTPCAVSVIGENIGNAIYLCRDYFDSLAVHKITGAQVWCYWFRENNVKIADVFRNQVDSRLVREVCNIDACDLIDARNARVMVLLPDASDTIRSATAIIKKLFDAGSVLNDFYDIGIGDDDRYYCDRKK